MRDEFSSGVHYIRMIWHTMPYYTEPLLLLCNDVKQVMKITELKPGMRGVNVEGRIDSITEPRTVNLRTGGTAQVADAMISDETGSIKLSLWDDQINLVKDGDNVAIENGYTQSFRGENSLNIGRYGKLKRL